MSRSTDVIVVGGGIVGASVAHFLAERGVGVMLLDAEHPAWGASGRNPGFVWLHTRAAGTQMDLALAGRRLLDRLADELDDFELRASGGMTYFFEAQADVFAAFADERRRAGLPVELLDGTQARTACPVLREDVAGATWNALDAHIRTAKLVDALLAAARRRGTSARSGARVARLDVSHERCRGVVLDDGTTLGGDVTVLAAGAWTPDLVRPLGVDVPIVAMRLQVAETEPAPMRFDPVLYGPTAVKQYAFVKDLPGYDAKRFSHPLEAAVPGLEILELAAQRADGRVLLGCPMDFPGLDDRPTVAGMALTFGVLADRLPALANLAVERTWAGLLPETPDALPILGPVDGVDGLVLATGHVFGNVAGPISGLLLAQQIAGEEPAMPLDVFALSRASLAESAAGHGRW